MKSRIVLFHKLKYNILIYAKIKHKVRKGHNECNTTNQHNRQMVILLFTAFLNARLHIIMEVKTTSILENPKP